MLVEEVGLKSASCCFPREGNEESHPSPLPLARYPSMIVNSTSSVPRIHEELSQIGTTEEFSIGQHLYTFV